jgi:2-hydroxychromene-2-carboxylate isomerase
MGDVIYLHDRAAHRNRPAADLRVHDIGTPSPGLRPPAVGGLGATRSAFGLGHSNGRSAAFFFELSSPFSYLAAERIERMLGAVTWVPTAPMDPRRGPRRLNDAPAARLITVAEQEAKLSRLPLVMPDGFPFDPRKATRAAAYASANGLGAAFALAAFRLAFCGGFDLESPTVLAEAAAAAGAPVRELLTAAEDPRWDAQPAGAARGLVGHRVASTPAIRVANRWFEGLDAVREASLFTTFRITHDAAGL